MKRLWILGAALLFSLQAWAQVEKELPGTNIEELRRLGEEFRLRAQQQKAEAVAWAIRHNETIRKITSEGKLIELMRLEIVNGDTVPIYYSTMNLQGAQTISTSKVWPGGSSGLSLTGNGYKVGVWDGGAVRTTHTEFNTGRAVVRDGSSSQSDHATHVAGTIGARGANTNAKGMAYEVNVDSYDWNSDASEMTSAAAAGLLVSNHSYGIISGWSFDTRYEWYGTTSISQNEDWQFGFYGSDARAFDQIAVNAPFYLIVRAAGNDRSDSGPGAGQTHYVRNSSGSWVTSTTSRKIDGDYDCIPQDATGKNVMTVGAVNGITNGYSTPSGVVMSSFSDWGPTDDGRIKPDIVTKGVNVTSAVTSSNTAYGSMSGTSMASPGAAGSAILLQQHYANLNSNAKMRSSTLKGLIIHTADEAGSNPGPDYTFGWGLMNTSKAASVISGKGQNHDIIETTLSNGGTYTKTVYAPGNTPLRVTICWIDPAGNVSSASLNPTTAKLVNDLDLRVSGNSTTYQPWVLNPANRTAAATTGDNTRDNVEQILISSPSPGTYTITVTHKGSLSGGSQNVSIIISGISPNSSTFCSGLTTLTAPSGTVTDGSGSVDYGNNSNCQFLIQPPGATSINLSFSAFATENSNDQVKVYNGADATAPLLGTYSGSTLPPNLSSTGGSMFITFVTNGSVTAAGWSASYTSVVPSGFCSGSTTLTASSGTFTDGSGAQNYQASANCNWLIQPPGATSITLTFNDFRTESGYDFVRVYDGSSQAATLLGTFSGSNLPSSLTSSGGSMFVKFTSDNAIEDAGWSASYTSSTQTAAFCSGTTTLTASSGTFDDGSASSNYANNSNCSWLIQPAGANSISLSFSAFRTESNNDLVRVYDGTSTAGTLLGSFSGTSLPSTVTSTGGNMFVTFTSNGSVTEAGWTANYTVPTSGAYCKLKDTLTAPSGTFSDGSGTNDYSNNANCTWLIQPAGATSITLSFSVFRTETGYDSVKVYNGTTAAAPLLGAFHGTSLPANVTANSGKMFVRFISDNSVTEAGWTASYTSVGSASYCSGTTNLTAASGSFTDGSGNNDYSNNANCKWLIQPAGAQSITLNFTAFATELDYDSVKVYDGSTVFANLLGGFTGSTLPTSVTSTGGTMLVVFTSDATVTAAGWAANYTSSSTAVTFCSGTTTLTAPSGTFNDGSGTANNYQNNANCSWVISPAGANYVRIKTISFNVESDSDFVAFFEGTQVSNATYIAAFSGDYTGYVVPDIVSSTGTMTVLFSSNATVRAPGWEFQYNSGTGAPYCSGTTTLTANAGTVSDGSSTNPYANNSDCRWLIQPPGATSITLKFNSLSVETDYDSVKVYNGGTIASPLLGAYTGNTVPANVTSTGGTMLVRFYSDNAIVGAGFDANYTSTGCTVTAATAGPDAFRCGSVHTMQGNTPAANETGTWTFVLGSGTLTNANSPTTTVTNLAAGLNRLRWTITRATCTAIDEVDVTAYPLTIPDAGPDQTVCVDQATMAANAPGAGQTGTWQVKTGSANIVNASSPTTQLTNLGPGQNKLYWIIENTASNGGCAVYDSVFVTNNSVQLADAGPNQTLCANTTTLAGTVLAAGETGTWTFVSGSGIVAFATQPNSGVSNLAKGTNVLRWTISKGSCSSSDTVVIVNNSVSTAAAGPNQSICANSTTLAANAPASGETGGWSVVSGSGNFVNVNDPATTVTGLGNGANVLRWRLTKGNCSSTSDVTITSTSNLNAVAGNDQTVCGTTATLAATAPAGGQTGTWTVVSGSATFANANSATSGVSSLAPGDNVLLWTLSNGTCTASDQVIITNNKPANVSAGPNQGVCAASAVMGASAPGAGETGTWSVVSGTGTFANPTDPQTQVNSLGTNNVYRWTVQKGSCTSSADVTITTGSLSASLTAIGDTVYCAGNPFNLNLQATQGVGMTYTWFKDGSQISGASASSFAPTQAGSYRATVVQGACTSQTGSISVTVNPAPVAGITPATQQNVCDGSTINLNANTGAGYTYKWFKNDTLISGANAATLSVGQTGVYKVEISLGNCTSVSSGVPVVRQPLPAAPVISQVSDSLVSTPGSTYQWANTTTGPIAGANLQAFKPSANGDYTVTITDANGCSATSSAFNYVLGSITLAQGAEFSLWPNPSTGQVHLAYLFPGAQGADLEVISPTGAQVYRTQLQGSQGSIGLDLSTQAAGVYLIRASRPGQILATARVVLVR